MTIIPHKCLWCDNKFDIGDIMIIKVPDGACFHKDCSEKFPDDNVYPENEGWLVEEFFPGIKLEKQEIIV